MSNDKISLDEIEDNGSIWEKLNSPEFKEQIQKAIDDATWGKGLPKVYMDEDGWIVKHWKDGAIEKIKKVGKQY